VAGCTIGKENKITRRRQEKQEKIRTTAFL
jgi:hypothetical protein